MPARAIPIDVLRAFVAVVKARGFTRAAEELGRTQPTISLQVKRLEELIETPLFENSTRLTLTRAGEICRDYGLRVLQAHDELFEQLARIEHNGETIRLGLPGDLAGFLMSGLAGNLFQNGGRRSVAVSCDLPENLVAAYRLNQLDVALVVSASDLAGEAAAQWRLPMAWVAARDYAAPAGQPIPLITTPENSCYREMAIAALRKAGQSFAIVCTSADFNVLRSAVASGAGVALMPRAIAREGLAPLANQAIAVLPEVTLSLFFAPSTVTQGAKELVSNIAEMLGEAGLTTLAA